MLTGIQSIGRAIARRHVAIKFEIHWEPRNVNLIQDYEFLFVIEKGENAPHLLTLSEQRNCCQ